MPKVIELSGVVGYDITARGLKNRLPKDGSDVVLKVDSPGGSVFEGNRLYNAILDYSGKIEVHLGVLAASASSYFPLAAGAENIKVRANTTFMGHKAWSFAIGNADEMKAEAEILDGLDRLIAKAYSKINGKSIDDNLIDMANEFWLIGGQSVVDAGFASGVIEDEDDDDEESKPIEKSEVQALIKEAKNTLQTLEIEEDLNKWAAKIDSELPENNEESNPDISGEINKEDSSMNLTEFLEKTPEAKAEYKAAIDEGVKAALDNVGELLNLAGIAEDTVKMAVSGMSAGEFAIAEVKKQNEARAAAKDKPAPQAIGNPEEMPRDTAPEASGKVKGIEGKVTAEQKAEIDKWDALYDEEEK